ncbi:hypothetical protein N0V90_012829 [Kalmusia sp. IMI 367209]|nr:hypothetical protein N0V90_012829 [Kalmusia sp. IMI 367209]
MDAADKHVVLVKAFRTLGGEDSELKAAFEQFRKVVQREEGIVRNATLASIQDLKIEVGDVHGGVKENLALTEQIGHNTDAIVARFLLARLQMGVLSSQPSAEKVQESLHVLPTKINAFYEDAIQRIEVQPDEDRQLARRALTYVYHTRRPLHLEELQHALSVEAGMIELDESGYPEMEIVLRVSAGMIRIDEKSNAVALVHHTLQEYLQQNPTSLLPQPESEMANVCLIYLSSDAFNTGPCRDGQVLEQRLQEYRFLAYASQYWGSHFICEKLHQDTDLLFRFLKSEEKLASSVQVQYTSRNRLQDGHNRFPRKFGPLHVAAFWGLDETSSSLCDEGIDMNTRDSYGMTPLHLAARHGHLTVVRDLLERGADVNISSNTDSS